MRIATRERVRVVRRDMPEHWGMLIGYGSAWTIVIGNHAPVSRWGYIVLHELAHLWLHRDGAELWEPLFTMADEVVGYDQREDEADTLAAMVLNPEVWR